jgi:hypothetical protein
MRLCDDLRVRFDYVSQLIVSGICDGPSSVSVPRSFTPNLRRRCDCHRKVRVFIRNWLTLTRQLCGQKTHTKKWRYAGCLGRGYFVTSSCQS